MIPENLKSNDLLCTYNPKVITFDHQEGVDQYTANQIIDLIQKKPNARLTMPTGKVKLLYQYLVEAYIQRRVDFSLVKIYNLDEYWPLKPEHAASYASFMKQNLIDHININPDNWHIPNGAAENPDIEAAHFLQELENSGGIDLAVLGIGPGQTCHIGFNEKGAKHDSRVRYVQLAEETAKTNIALFADPKDFPYGAITQGVADILDADKILLLAKGQNKAWGVHRSLKGQISAEAPASLLRFHKNVTFVLDQTAASLLQA